jgi:drug/metabolite transporter (DMT)-like permease
MIKPEAWVFEFLLLSAIWGVSFLFQRIAALEFGTFALTLVRVGSAALFLIPFALYRKDTWKELKGNTKPLFFVGILNSALPFACFAYALQNISTGLGSILNATVPLFGAIVAWVWLGDRLDTSRIVGLLIGCIGMVMLSVSQTNFRIDGTIWAILACLLATLCYAIGASFVKKYLNHVSSLGIATGSQISASLLLLLPGLYTWPTSTPSIKAVISGLLVGTLCTGIAYLLLFKLIRDIGPSKTVTLTFIIPVFALITGVLFLDEVVTLAMLFWAGFIFLGTSLATGLWNPNIFKKMG